MIENAILICEIRIDSFYYQMKHGIKYEWIEQMLEEEERKLKALEAAKWYLKQNK